MTVDLIIDVLVVLTLIEMMAAIGLGVTLADTAHVAGDWRLIARAVLANYVLVPAVVVGLLPLIQAPPLVAAGFLVTAVCPGAPYGPPFTALAKGDMAISVGVMVMLAGSSAVVTPPLLAMLLHVASEDQPLKIDAMRMVGTLLLTQLAPLGIGLAVRQYRPALADRLRRPANRLSVGLNLVAIGAIAVVDFHLLDSVRSIEFVAMLALVLIALVVGWLLGGPGGNKRRAMAFSTGVRNVAVSLVIARASFPGTPAVTTVLAYAVVQTAVLALLAAGWGRWATAADRAA